MTALKIVVGLGNPGTQYARTRHNVGAWCIDRLARRLGADFQRRKLVLIAQESLAGQPVVLARPRTFMNLSGEPVRYLLDRFHARPADLIIILDDMDLPPGKIRIRPNGSSGGHKGLDSIIARLGTQDFPRIRIGIGHPERADAVSHVLGPLKSDEATLIHDAVERAMQAVEVILTEGLDAAMNQFN